MLPCGDLGDRHGHKRVVLAGLAAFGAGSLAAGLAPGPALLVAGRVVQGVGAALLLPGTLAVVSRAYPDAAERARAIGVWAAISSLALPAGVIAGGALVDGPGWRWAFLVNLPVVAVALPVTARVVRESTRDRRPRARRPGRRAHGGSAGDGDLRDHRPLARGRRSRRRAAGGAWWRSSAGARSRCCPRRSSAARPSAPPTPSPPR